MGDVLSRIACIVFGCLVMFIVPVMLIAQKQDTISQSYIDNAVVEFVDNARTSGKITPQAYEKLCNKIDSAQMRCEINIIHSSAYTVPTEEIDPETGYYKTVTYRNDFIKSEILDVMYPDVGDNKDYSMKSGDYLKVEVHNAAPTFGTKMVRLFTTKNADITLYTSYGGYVGNNEQ